MRPWTAGVNLSAHTRPARKISVGDSKKLSVNRTGISSPPTLLEAGWASGHFDAVFQGKGQEVIIFIIVGRLRNEAMKAIRVGVKARSRGRGASVDTGGGVRPGVGKDRALEESN